MSVSNYNPFNFDINQMYQGFRALGQTIYDCLSGLCSSIQNTCSKVLFRQQNHNQTQERSSIVKNRQIENVTTAKAQKSLSLAEEAEFDRLANTDECEGSEIENINRQIENVTTAKAQKSLSLAEEAEFDRLANTDECEGSEIENINRQIENVTTAKAQKSLSLAEWEAEFDRLANTDECEGSEIENIISRLENTEKYPDDFFIKSEDLAISIISNNTLKRTVFEFGRKGLLKALNIKVPTEWISLGYTLPLRA